MHFEKIPLIQIDCVCSNCGAASCSPIECSGCRKQYCASCCDSDLCTACQAASSFHAASAASVNSHNHFSAVIDYSRSKFMSALNPYEIMIYEIQNLFRTVNFLGGAAQSHEFEVGNSQSCSHLASVVGFTPTRYSAAEVASSSEIFLNRFGIPNFSLSTQSVRHDEQHFINTLFNFKVCQRLCLAENLFTAKWMPKTYVCCIEVGESQTQAVHQITTQLQSIYNKASRFLSPALPWVLKIHAARGEGNVFVDGSSFQQFASAVTDFMKSKPGTWICLIEEVHNIGKQRADNISKTYRSVVYYNALTDEFKMQNIYCYLTEGSVDSHKAQRWRYYPAAIGGSYQNPREDVIDLQREKVEHNLNVAQHKSGLFYVFKKLCQHVTRPKETFWDPLVQTFLPIYVHRPLNDKLLFDNDETVVMVQEFYRRLAASFYA